MAVSVFLAVAEKRYGVVSAFLSQFFEYRLKRLFFELTLVLSYEFFLIEAMARPVLDMFQLTAEFSQPNIKPVVFRPKGPVRTD